jgi:cytochrome b subunit of formate dehydrogenase
MTIARACGLFWLALFAASHALAQPIDTQLEELAQAASAAPAATETAPAVPVKGSQIPREENQCATCHTESVLWEGDKMRLFLPLDSLERDIHWQKGVACIDCHGGDHTNLNYAEAHAGMIRRADLRQRCVHCHKDENLSLLKGVHAKAGERDERGRRVPLDCVNCHGTNPHEMLPAKDERSPMYLMHQVDTCGSCHPEDQKTYRNTPHGRGLYESGLRVSAVCADCHGSHGMYYAADGRSTLHPLNVADTCSKCHQSLEERLLKSVHGRVEQAATDANAPSLPTKIKRTPECTDCHAGHSALSPELARFRPPTDDRCGNCHTEVYSRYARRMHSTLTDGGYVAAAQCGECHGSHDILPVRESNSQLATGVNRLQTCQKCHVHAVSNFAEFNPHANFKDGARFPELHSIYEWIKFLLNVIFACYFTHAALWFVRAFIDRLQHGREPTLVAEQFALSRFDPLQRMLYGGLLVSFLGLAVTGLALKHSMHSWGQWLARGLGGFQSTSSFHQSFAMFAIIVFAIYTVGALAGLVRRREEKTWEEILFGPDSLVPNGRDVRDFYRMLFWFIGFGPKPGFERWAYWEKLDFWAFLLVTFFIGFSGAMSWFPNLFCLVLPGSALNMAKVIHSEFSLYMASLLFLIHFFHAHLRPEKFPMDLSLMTGLVSETHLRKHRPDYIARLEREGRLDEMRQVAPSRRNVWFKMAAGFTVFTLGLCLRVVAVLAGLEE